MNRTVSKKNKKYHNVTILLVIYAAVTALRHYSRSNVCQTSFVSGVRKKINQPIFPSCKDTHMGLLYITDGPLLQPHTVADNNNPGQQHVQNLYSTLTKLWGDSPSLVLVTHIKQMHTCKVYAHLWDCLSLRHCPEPFCSPQSYTDNEEAVSVVECNGKDWLGRTRVCLHVTEYQSLVSISLLDQIKMKFQAFGA